MFFCQSIPVKLLLVIHENMELIHSAIHTLIMVYYIDP